MTGSLGYRENGDILSTRDVVWDTIDVTCGKKMGRSQNTPHSLGGCFWPRGTRARAPPILR